MGDAMYRLDIAIVVTGHEPDQFPGELPKYV
jgi:hypothetical protein